MVSTTMPAPATPSIPTTTPGLGSLSASLPLPGPGRSLVGHSQGELTVYRQPEASEVWQTMPAVTILGTPQVYLVEEGPRDGWVRVALPGRPNGSSGWVEASRLRFATVEQLIKVDLGSRTLTFLQAGIEVFTAPVAIGSAQNPTPAGRFYVTDVVQLADPDSAWGPFALGLSARSETITEFNGGDGIVGIHGTNRPGTIGRAVSLGCIRLDNDLITRLAGTIRLGTPVEIEPGGS
jgi:hypothetical protein